jgi:DNA processing protein
MGETLVDWIALSLVPGLGVSSYWRLLDRFETPQRVFDQPRQELQRIPGVRDCHLAGLFAGADYHQQARDEVHRLTAIGGFALAFSDDHYPPLLRRLPDPPPVLYGMGRRDLLQALAVAVVGSRAATGYGRKVAFTLGQQLAAAGFTVVSGLALGIDAQAHAGALQGGGATAAVLGCGLDIVYPRLNRHLFDKIRDHGVLLSEYPLGTQPEGFRFPARNRIIAGMSGGVVVVEAAKRSGSLITAQIALDCGREVFAVPGHIDSRKSEGTHWLLKQGAKLVQGVDDIVEEMGGTVRRGDGGHEIATRPAEAELEPDAARLLDLIDSYPQARETLLAASALTPARLNQLLLGLELDGHVELLAGDRVRKRAENEQ